MKASS